MAVIFTFAITVAQSSVADYKGVASSSISETKQIADDEPTAEDETAESGSSEDESSEDSSSEDSSSTEDTDSSEEESDGNVEDAQDEGQLDKDAAISSQVTVDEIPVLKTLGDIASGNALRAASDNLRAKSVPYGIAFPTGDGDYPSGQWPIWRVRRRTVNGWYTVESNAPSENAAGDKVSEQLTAFFLDLTGNISQDPKYTLFCLEPPVAIIFQYSSKIPTEITGGSAANTSYWNKFAALQTGGAKLEAHQIQNFIGRILYYGKVPHWGDPSSTGSNDGKWNWSTKYKYGEGSLARQAAVQLLIWETIAGERTSTFNHIYSNPTERTDTFVSSFNESSMWSDSATYGSGNTIKYWYEKIRNQVQAHIKKPSFADNSYNILQGDTLNLTDSNGVLENYTATAVNGVTLTKSGNTLKIKVNSSVSDTAYTSITFTKKAERILPTAYTDTLVGNFNSKDGVENVQDVVGTGNVTPDNITFTIKVKRALGSVKLTKADSTNTSLKLSGATFRIYQKQDDGTFTSYKDMTDNGNGIYSYDRLPFGTYRIKEITPPPGYKILTSKDYDFNITGTNYTEVRNIGTITNEPAGSVSLTKVDSTNNTIKLSGATFTIYTADGTKWADMTDNGNGAYSYNKLRIGSYYIQETKAPAGYKLNSTKYSFNITASALTATVNNGNPITNEPAGSVSLTKVDSTNNTIKLSGATFTIYTADGTKWADMTDNGTGTYSYDKLRIGSYYIQETKAPTGYKLNSTQYPFSITASALTATVNGGNPITNEPAGSVSLTKVDSTNNTIKLSGATFTIYTADGTKWADMTDNGNGAYSYNKLRIGSYYIQETKAPAGYKLNSTQYPFSITASNLNATVNSGKPIPNTPLGSIQLTKVDASDHSKKLTGAQFKVYKGDTEVGTMTHSGNGVYSLGDLELGTYSIKETVVPEGYRQMDDITVEITAAGQTAIAYNDASYNTVTNTPIGSIKLTKKDEATGNVLTGASFTVYQDADGDKEIDEKEIVGEMKDEDEDGVYSLGDLELGTYSIKETVVPAGYQEIAIPDVEITEAGQIAIAYNNDAKTDAEKAVVNRPVSLVKLSKMDADTQNLLSGAEFTVYEDAGGGTPGAEVSKMIERENQKGIYELKDLPVGNYLVKETKAPTIEINGEKVPTHILPEEDVYYPFSITKAGEEATVNRGAAIENSPILGSMKLTKVDASDYSIKLSGAEFTVYADTDGNGEYTAGTDTSVGTMQEGTGENAGVYTIPSLRVGTYFVEETKAPEEYVRDLAVRTVYVKDEEEIILEFPKEGTEVVTNAKVYGSVELTKVSSENAQEYLSGAEFTVYTDLNENGKLDVTAELDETKTSNGTMLYDITDNKYKLKGIPTGKYLVVETKAPEGYLLEEKVYPFEIPASSDGGEILIQIDGDSSTTGTIDPITNTPVGSVSLKKIDAELKDAEGKPVALSGAEFTVYAHDDDGDGIYEDGECGEAVSTLSHTEGIMTDNGDGSYKLENLPYGNYLVKETKAPTVEIDMNGNGTIEAEEIVSTHILDGTYYPFSITSAGQAVEIDGDSSSTDVVDPIPNTPVKGSVQLTKVAADGLEAGENLSGAVFTVYADSNGDGTLDADESNAEPVGTMQEGEGDNAGVYTLGDLRVGTYFVKETEAPKGYLLDAGVYKFTITQGETAEIITNNDGENFENKAKNWKIKIVKKDAESNNYIAVAGATFQIFAPNDTGNETPIALDGKTEFVTDEAGTIITEGNTETTEDDTLAYGKGYKLVETKAPEGYVLDSTSVVFDVTDEETNTNFQSGLILVEKIDARQKGKIQITKTGEVASSLEGNAEDGYQIVYEEAGLAGVEFKVIAADDILSPDGSKGLDGQRVVIYNKDTVVATITTDAGGTATIEDLPLGKYKVQEVEAPVGYMLIENTIDANIEYDDTGAAEAEPVELEVNNTRRKFKINFSKMLEEDERGLIEADLERVKFGLYTNGELTVGETTLAADTLLEKITVNADGTAQCQSDLPAGSYYLKEIETQEEYILSEAKYEFVLSYEETKDEIIEVTVDDREEDADTAITNKLIKGSVSLQKVDAGINEEDSQKGTALSGAEFTVYKDAETIGEYDENEDILVEAMTDNKDGSYKLENLPYGNYLVKETKAPTVEIDMNGNGTIEDGEKVPTHILDETYYQFSITEDGQVVAIDGDAEAEGVDPIPNEPVKGSVKLEKIDSETKEKLSGVEFALYEDANGNRTLDDGEEQLEILEEGTEENIGIYMAKDLRVGTYLIKEERTPVIWIDLNGNGIEEDNEKIGTHILDGKVYPFSITEDDQIVEINRNNPIENTPIEGSVKLTKIDSETKEALSGAEFTVYEDSNGNGSYDETEDKAVNIKGFTDGVMKDEQGEHTMDGLRVGRYFIKETKVPTVKINEENIETHKKSDTVYTFMIKDNKEAVQIDYDSTTEEINPIENEPIKGAVQLRKIDSEIKDSEGNPVALSGAEFTVYDKNNKEVGKMSEEEGVYILRDLRVGEYYVRETKTPTVEINGEAIETHVLDETKYWFNITNNKTNEEIDYDSSTTEEIDPIPNAPKFGSAKLTKVDEDFINKKLPGSVFMIYKDEDMNKEYDPSIDTEIGEMKDNEGVYTIENLRYGYYLLKEIQAPVGYQVDPDYYSFTIQQEKQTLVGNAGESYEGKFLEEPEKGIFKLIKTDMSDGSLLEGVGFRIRNSEGEVVYEGYTNQYGEIETPLRYGKYTYQEFQALEGYTLDDTEYEFEIKEDGQVIKAEMQNNKNPDNPQVKTKGTGQSNEMVYVFILISVVCLFAISMIIKNRRKN